MVLDSRTILGSATANEDDTVLLDIVTCREHQLASMTRMTFQKHRIILVSSSLFISLFSNPPNPKGKNHIAVGTRTFTGNISRNHTPTTQSHSCRLPLSRVRLLWLRNTRLQTHALHLRPIMQRRRSSLADGLRNTTSLSDLVVCCLGAGRAGERAPRRDGGGRAEDRSEWFRCSEEDR